MWRSMMRCLPAVLAAAGFIFGGCSDESPPEPGFPEPNSELVGLWRTSNLTIDGEPALVYEAPGRTALHAAAQLHFDVLNWVGTKGPSGGENGVETQQAGAYSIDGDSVTIRMSYREGQPTDAWQARAHWLVVDDLLELAFRHGETQVVLQSRRFVMNELPVRVAYYSYDDERWLGVEFTAASPIGSCTDGPGCSAALWLADGSYTGNLIRTNCEHWSAKWPGLNFCYDSDELYPGLTWWVYSTDGRTITYSSSTPIYFE
jgi:hypothetical protein